MNKLLQDLTKLAEDHNLNITNFSKQGTVVNIEFVEGDERAITGAPGEVIRVKL